MMSPTVAAFSNSPCAMNDGSDFTVHEPSPSVPAPVTVPWAEAVPASANALIARTTRPTSKLRLSMTLPSRSGSLCTRVPRSSRSTSERSPPTVPARPPRELSKFRISQDLLASDPESSQIAGFSAAICVGLQRFRHDSAFLEHPSVTLKRPPSSADEPARSPIPGAIELASRPMQLRRTSPSTPGRRTVAGGWRTIPIGALAALVAMSIAAPALAGGRSAPSPRPAARRRAPPSPAAHRAPQAPAPEAHPTPEATPRLRP